MQWKHVVPGVRLLVRQPTSTPTRAARTSRASRSALTGHAHRYGRSAGLVKRTRRGRPRGGGRSRRAGSRHLTSAAQPAVEGQTKTKLGTRASRLVRTRCERKLASSSSENPNDARQIITRRSPRAPRARPPAGRDSRAGKSALRGSSAAGQARRTVRSTIPNPRSSTWSRATPAAAPPSMARDRVFQAILPCAAR